MITSAKFPLPFKVKYSQNLGISTRTSLGGRISCIFFYHIYYIALNYRSNLNEKMPYLKYIIILYELTIDMYHLYHDCIFLKGSNVSKLEQMKILTSSITSIDCIPNYTLFNSLNLVCNLFFLKIFILLDLTEKPA